MPFTSFDTGFKYPDGVTVLSDSDRYKNRFAVRSESNPAREYVVSYDTATKQWDCSCPAGRHGHPCKHRTRYGLTNQATRERAAIFAEVRDKAVADSALAKLIATGLPLDVAKRIASHTATPIDRIFAANLQSQKEGDLNGLNLDAIFEASETILAGS